MSNVKHYHGKFIYNPHVVLLGAGASKAAFPHGDANGTKLPLMEDIVTTVGLSDIVDSLNVPDEERNNFELLYSNLVQEPANAGVVKEIEERIYGYFSTIELPPEITIYDKLILSLRDKDLIATFNWDPLLLLSYRRCGIALNRIFNVDPPPIAFLHGNVSVGICREDKVTGFLNNRCSQCGRHLEPSRLLYPITCKNYSDDPFIEGQWELLRDQLQRSFFFTVYGYSAPKTDLDAIALMKESWTNNPRHKLCQLEIIDIQNENELEDSWDGFIVSHHYHIARKFEDSYMYHYPRRSIEAFFDCYMQCEPWRRNPLPKVQSVEELFDWLYPLLEQEANDICIPNWSNEDQ